MRSSARKPRGIRYLIPYLVVAVGVAIAAGVAAGTGYMRWDERQHPDSR